MITQKNSLFNLKKTTLHIQRDKDKNSCWLFMKQYKPTNEQHNHTKEEEKNNQNTFRKQYLISYCKSKDKKDCKHAFW